MKHITILATNGTMASTVTGPMDIFSQAGILWNRICGFDETKFFDVEIATVDGLPVECHNRLFVKPHAAMENIDRTDLIIISSESLDLPQELRDRITPWLCRHAAAGTDIASICTGAFILAETGLLNGKTATTHWGFADLFRKRFPEVILKPERIITRDGNLYCGGGAHSYFDLSLYLVEKYCNYETAVRCANSLLLDFSRNSQLPYAVFEFQKRHRDREILKAQEMIEKRFAEDVPMTEIAESVGMGVRNFKRRFKTATGDSPLAYLQRYRMETAKRLLEDNLRTITEIASAVGYEDICFFRDLFKRYVRMPPVEYRRKFEKGTKDTRTKVLSDSGRRK